MNNVWDDFINGLPKLPTDGLLSFNNKSRLPKQQKKMSSLGTNYKNEELALNNQLKIGSVDSWMGILNALSPSSNPFLSKRDERKRRFYG